MTGRRDEWLGFTEIAGITGLPEANLRRWRKLFPGWLPSKTFGRAERFRPEVVAVFQRIAQLFGERRGRAEIEATLRAESAPVIDVSPEGEVREGPRLQNVENSVLERIAMALERLAESQAAIAVELARRVDRVEAMAVALAANRPVVSASDNSQVIGQVNQEKGVSATTNRATIIERVRGLRHSGMGAGAIATQLRREDVPTLSGRGAWGSGSVRRILKMVSDES